MSAAAAQLLTTLEANSFTHNDHILDTHVVTEEIEFALKALKLGRSKGTDGLKAEHLIYRGTSLMLWLQKIFNSIITLEEIPNFLKKGIIVPVYKGRGKDPLSPISYHGITLSSKTFEIVLLERMSPILEETGFPDMNQTAFQKVSAIFSTQEVLLKIMFIRGIVLSCVCMTLKRHLTLWSSQFFSLTYILLA